jgi:hypothetical protein
MIKKEMGKQWHFLDLAELEAWVWFSAYVVSVTAQLGNYLCSIKVPHLGPE